MTGSEITESDGREECGGEEEDEEALTGREESIDNTGDECAEQQHTEGAEQNDLTEEHQEDAIPEANEDTQGPDDVVELKPDEDVEENNEENKPVEDDDNEEQETIPKGSHDDVEDAEVPDEEDEGKIVNQDWDGNQGDSADGEDEADEESDEAEDDTDCGEQDLVPSKTENGEAATKASQKKTLMTLDALIKVKAESDDGAYADVEDSENEMNSQEEVTCLESKTLKNNSS
ncbi:hypothetical protein PBY51_006852 [Eleginops maclovinus]|uniref:Uncharacterized protein n=3 Tax=Eleginops maclovinus TaxID=56733 RepID=A0AAN7X2Z0_ELEMC|nr:hypothetical protein PBY51_006852 [Eleginops maclovinus]